jgi:type IV pilus assembly protein PilA
MDAPNRRGACGLPLGARKGYTEVHALKALAARRQDDEQGFTLIELMVVVLIIAILIAIAIPTFLGARARAQDRAAQSDLRNGLTAEKTVYTDSQKYDDNVGPPAGVMKGVESSLDWGGKLTVAVGDVVAGDKGVVCLSETSKSGKVFNIADVASGTNAGTFFNKGGTCASTAPATLSAAAWNTGW